MTYPEALTYLNCLINYEKRGGYDYRASFKLDRMRKLCSLLGDPQGTINAIHVAGTKGKGSTCSFLHSILRSAGFKTGLYTSPHLSSFLERIRIGDTLITEADLSRLADKVRAACANLDDAPTFFEVCTAIAYLYFSEKKADFAVYEVGLGGRLDATNIIEPLVSVITPISYEHTELLGSTLAEIAGEKAGIIKQGGICISAPQEAEALSVIERACEAKKNRLVLVGRDITYKELEETDTREAFSVDGAFEDYGRLETNLLGAHQAVNATVAIGAAEALRLHGVTISADAVGRGIASAAWPGRLEVMRRRPLIVLDGAQNRASAAALAKAVKKLFEFKKLILVLGVSKDKDVRGILDELLPTADDVVLTRSNIAERALEPSKIADILKECQNRRQAPCLTGSVGEAIRVARGKTAPEDLMLVTGSLFVVGEARDVLIGEKKCVQQA